MKIAIRRKLDMAARVRDFVRTHPDTNPGYLAAIERLVERLVHAESVAQQEIAGRRSVTGAVATRDRLREEIADTLALLSGLARQAAHDEAELSAGIARPDASASSQSFLTRGRVAAATAVTHRALLQRYGMPDTFPEDLGRLLDEFETALNDKHAGRASHVGANAELAAVANEIMGIVMQLGALVRFRFRNDAEALAAWRSARNVAWPSTDRSGTPPADGSVQPAA